MELSKAARLARLHGAFNLLGGIWPILHLRSFEAVLGPKVDRWLVYTVAGLMMSIGTAQVSVTDDSAALRKARQIGIGCAATLALVDAIYVPRRRISPMYLLDVVAEGGWLIAWATTSLPSSNRSAV